MAKQTILVSDLTDNPIPEGEGATVRIRFHDDTDNGVVELHVIKSEVSALIEKGRKQKHRGRKPANESVTEEAAS